MRNLDPTAGDDEVELTLTNRSPKDLVAFAYDISIRDGSSGAPQRRGGAIEDLTASYASVGRRGPANYKYAHLGPIGPGASIYSRTSLGSAPGSVVFSVTALLFGDNTALGDPVRIASWFSEHQTAADELERWVARLRDGPGAFRAHAKDWLDEMNRERPSVGGMGTFLRDWLTEAKARDIDENWFRSRVNLAYLTDLAATFREHSKPREGL